MVQHTVAVVSNQPLAQRTYRLRLADPAIGRCIRPGQFVMLRLPGLTDPLLGRPFALYDTFLDGQGAVAGYDLVYLVVGKMTGRMSRLTAGDRVQVWGPLGNGFPLAPTEHLMLVAGGIGQTPFPAVARAYLGLRCYGTGPSGGESEGAGRVAAESPDRQPGRLARHVTLCYGVATASLLAGLDDFRGLGVEVQVATDDGSAGHCGPVTELVAARLAGPQRPSRLFGCGPEPMLRRLAQLAAAARLPCHLSLETHMACGLGACFSCVVPIRQPDGHWDYRRVCVDGPVFEAEQVIL